MAGLRSNALLGIRIDPLWQDGDRIADLRDNSNIFTRGSVLPEDRVPAHAAILPYSVGAFVLSADCFPLLLRANSCYAFCHLGWKSVRDNLVKGVVERLRTTGLTEKLYAYIGPGIRYNETLSKDINTQLTTISGVSVAYEDPRDTYTDAALFSRRQYHTALASNGALKVPLRGNHVVIAKI